MLNRMGYDFKFALKIKFSTNVPVSQCSDEWESEEIAAETFDMMADRVCEAFDDCELVDTDFFNHEFQEKNVYKVTSAYLFEAIVRGIDYDDACEWIDSYVNFVDVPADVEMKLMLLECMSMEPALAVVGE